MRIDQPHKPGVTSPRRLAALAFFLVAGLLAHADSEQVERLSRAYADAAPAEKSALLSELSAAIETDDTARAWEYAEQARREALTPTDEVRADTRRAALQRRRGEYADALATARAALERATSLGAGDLRMELLLVIANTYDSLADFPAALETFAELVPLAEARGDPHFLARVHNVLGVTHADSGQNDRARRAYQTARTFAEQSGDRRILGSVLNNLGNIALVTGELADARRHHEQALAVREAHGGDSRGVADSHQNLAELAILEGNPAAAVPHLEKAIAIHTTLGLKRNLANANLTYAAALRALGRNDEALTRLTAAGELADSLGAPVILARVYRGFAAFHEAQGNFREALAYERKLADATEAAIGERSRQRVDLLQASFEAERREHEIDVLRREQALREAALARVRAQRFALLALALLVCAASAAVISRQIFKRRADQRILAETRAGRDAAEQADRLKTRLIHMVSHDIRGPAGNILALGEDLRDRLPTSPTDQRMNLVLTEAQRVLDLAQDLLDAAALESGRLQVDRTPVDLSDIVRATIGRMTLNATSKEQRIEFQAPPGNESTVIGDGKRLAQVTANLLSNALKFSPPGSLVRLAVNRAGDRVQLRIADQGPGIPPDQVPQLFRPFAQLTARPTGNESSHGLGLSIVHDLVRLQGGTVRVQANAGGGSIFIVDLPALG